MTGSLPQKGCASRSQERKGSKAEKIPPGNFLFHKTSDGYSCLPPLMHKVIFSKVD
jgi:hypothetical protein